MSDHVNVIQKYGLMPVICLVATFTIGAIGAWAGLSSHLDDFEEITTRDLTKLERKVESLEERERDSKSQMSVLTTEIKNIREHMVRQEGMLKTLLERTK